ncbi:MAG: hypothetical protein ACTTJH_00660 [Bacteroidales bacterium]
MALLRSNRKQARAKALQAEMELGKSYVDEYSKNIVEPIKEEVITLRKDINGLKREIARFRRAVNKANGCQWVDSCPVVRELQTSENDNTEGANRNDQGEIFPEN